MNRVIRSISSLVSPFAGSVAKYRWAHRDIKNYYTLMGHSSKPFIIDYIVKSNPKRILEIGCASGPNVALIAKRLPQSDVLGLDINKEAVDYGNYQMLKENLSNAYLFHSSADKIYVSDNSFDLVFTCAVMTHIPPGQVDRVLHELFRVSSHRVILIEPSLSGSTDMATYWNFTWLRNYPTLLKQLGLASIMKVTKIPIELWPDKPWGELGVIMDIEK